MSRDSCRRRIPRPASVASLTTIMSRSFDASFRRPFATASFVSSANPTTTAPRRRALLRRQQNVGRRRERDRRGRFGLLDLRARRRPPGENPPARPPSPARRRRGSSRSTAAAMSVGRFHRLHARRPAARATLSGPATRSTLAPRRHAAAASATPILPLLWFEMNRTGSIASRVGPAVTSTRLPASARVAARAGGRHARRWSSGSGMRPGPLPSPAASMPSSGSTTAVAELAQVRRRCAASADAPTCDRSSRARAARDTSRRADTR